MVNWGTILSCDKDKAVIITEDCSFINVKIRKDMVVGQEIAFDESDLYHKTNKLITYLPKVTVFAAGFVLCLILTFVFNKEAKVFAYIDVDINPSVEFVLDENEVIIDMIGINDDGKKVLKQVSLTGMEFKDAIEAYIQEAINLGYLEEEEGRSILLSYSLTSTSKVDEESFYEYITSLENLTDNSDYSYTIIKVSVKTKEQADANGISMGRQAAYLNALESGSSISVEDIRDSSVSEVMEIIFTNQALLQNGESDNGLDIINDSDNTTGTSGTDSSASVSDFEAQKERRVTIPDISTKEDTTTTQKDKETTATAKTSKTEETTTTTPTEKVVTPVVTTPVHTVPSLQASSTANGIVLSWNKISDSDFTGYKVVISQNDSTPAYPENGYLFYITDANQTSVTVDNSSAYNNGDFGSYLVAGTNYYFSITALYGETRIPGNTVALSYPVVTTNTQPVVDTSSQSQSLSVSGSVVDGKIRLNWNQLSSNNFNYYKVVISKSNAAPSYPNDGYMTYFTDSSVLSYDISAGSGYNGGDFGGVVTSGETYYFSITGVYNDFKIIGNSVSITVP